MINKEKGFTSIEIIIVLFVVVGFGSWIFNTVKFASCDFEPDYKCEITHGTGVLVAPLSVVTVWFSDDES
jgi:hypothetical protein